MWVSGFPRGRFYFEERAEVKPRRRYGIRAVSAGMVSVLTPPCASAIHSYSRT